MPHFSYQWPEGVSEKLTRNFRAYEWFITGNDLHETLNPKVSESEAAYILRTAKAVQLARDHFGFPFWITSGHRAKELNTAIGGSKTSAHMYGRAIDFRPRDKWASKHTARLSKEIAEWMWENVEDLDQVIYYDLSRGGHVHFGIAAKGKKSRGELRHAAKGGGYPVIKRR